MFPGIHERFRTECIGIPPYPGSTFPRVAGFLSCRGRTTPSPSIRFLQGDVLSPRGHGPKIIVHVVSDATPNWGGNGVAVSIRRRWPKVQEEFRAWAASQRRLRLGDTHFREAQDGIEIASMICQHGYGDSARPRLRYAALESALSLVAIRAKARSASLHMPRIGCGQAGGSWTLVEEIIGSTLLDDAKLPVTVYDLPDAPPATGPRQLSLADAS